MKTEVKDIQATIDNPGLQYLIREPKITSLRTKAIVLLHGVGSNEADLFNLSDHLPDDFYVISARGPFALGAGRFAWYNVDFSTGKPVFNAEQELTSRQAITKFIAVMRKKYSIDDIYLGGFSQGAIMSYSVGLSYPGEVAGVIGFSGRILDEIQSSITSTDDLTKLKIFLAHGVQDDKLPIHYAREGKRFLEKLRVKLSYHEYPIGHQINGAVLKDLNGWLAD
jgi:phospholipase/carboxylesterase